MTRSNLRRALVAALAALALLFGFANPISAEDAKPVTAILLAAQSELSDPFFADSVVLVMNNLGPAPIGIIINRPTSVAVSSLFPDLKRLAKLPDKVYFGGPVEVSSVWFLFRAAKPPKEAVQVLDGVCLSANRTLLLQLLGRDQPLDGMRIFAGHSGWAPGQLEGEIRSGAWTLEHAEPDAIFNGQSEHPWPSAPELPKHST